MNPLFVPPVWRMAQSFSTWCYCGLGRQRTEDKRAFSDEPRGMSQPDFTRQPFFLLPALPLTFSPCVVGSYAASLLSFALRMPSHLFLLLKSLYLSLFSSLSLAPGTAVWWQKPVTAPCHDRHSSMPVNDTQRYTSPWLPDWVPAESAAKVTLWQRSQCRVQWRWHQQLWVTLFWQHLPPTLCHHHRFSQRMLWDGERAEEMEDWEMWVINWLYLAVQSK